MIEDDYTQKGGDDAVQQNDGGVGSLTNARYRKYNTRHFKTHFSALLRSMQRGDFDAAIITAHGRDVGVFFPHPDTLARK